uniref:AlNc14C108G6296 protein n=1 Tax=Albugo laibachii Nc14 TaxID=890382 RepID=F0WI89_9STRA|nr:AlNc14C108G6296 [Albugo laibachii Nc14]|eukprot:CCA20968.1 AlNc14C108G6296 [Albugo laibachii Nc14]
MQERLAPFPLATRDSAVALTFDRQIWSLAHLLKPTGTWSYDVLLICHYLGC